MKTLILFSSKYGCTEDCVNHLKSKLNHPTKVVNLANETSTDLQGYDQIIIGSSIYIGKIRKQTKIFCEQNLSTLLTKKVILFLCCTTPDQIDNFFKDNFPTQLLDHASKTVNFGGELRPDKMGFFDKKITALVSKTQSKKVEILYANINGLATSIN